MARVNEVVNYLQVCQPAALELLKTKYPEVREALVTDLAGIAVPATRIKAEATVMALTDFEPRIAPLLALAVRKARDVKSKESVATLCTAIAASASAVVAFLPPSWDSAKILTAVTTAIGSIYTWSAKRDASTMFDQTRNTQVTLLVDSESQIREWVLDLKAYLDASDTKDYSEQAELVIEKANKLMREINRNASDLNLR